MADLRITDLNDRAGHWAAVVLQDGTPVAVDRRHGSWQSERTEGVRRFVLPGFANELQIAVRFIEKQRAKDAKEAEDLFS